MNVLDIVIIIFIIVAVIRGREAGFVRQFFSTLGFFGGLLLGASLQPYTIKLVTGEASESLVTIGTTIGTALLCMAIGEYIGIIVKQKIEFGKLNKTDNSFGSLLAAISMLLIVWLSANIFASIPSPSLQTAIEDSRIVSSLTDRLPPAPGVISRLGSLIDPNGFPDVFTGREPTPGTSDVTPTLDGFDTAINATKDSIVKIEGQGCGGIVEGTGFVVGDGIIATNAHVIAGIRNPYVMDANGNHKATAIWFDPDLDFAILKTSNLAGATMTFDTTDQANGTKAAVLGYPGGGPLDAEAAVVLDRFIATGRDIYGKGSTEREVYEVNSHIIPGNSGGPMITSNGRVVGVVFAQSTSYDNVGYALTAEKVVSEINAAKLRNTTVSTAGCAED